MGKLNFYHDEPIFGLDIGRSTLKVMQVESKADSKPKIIGYGYGKFQPHAISSGVIVDYQSLAASLHDLLEEQLAGMLSTKRVACSIPTARTFSRAMKLPAMNDKDISEAVMLEAEQYIPLPAANLYIDYEITHQDNQGIELLMVASPKNIVDSHIQFLEGVGLEPVALEPTLNAAARFFGMADTTHSQPASVLIDFGSDAIDLAVFDQTMLVNSTLDGGSNDMTQLISQKLDINQDDAYKIKSQYGIGVSDYQPKVKEALMPLLENLKREVEKIERYYDERVSSGERKISQIIIMGGGSTMPGFSQYLSGELKLPTHTLDPWSRLDFGSLPPPPDGDRPMYVTVAGQALLQPGSILK